MKNKTGDCGELPWVTCIDLIERLIMKFKVVPIKSLKKDLSTESFIHPPTFKGTENVPIMGDFATQIAQRLNEIFSKTENEQDNMVESMGRDMGDKHDPTKSYMIGRNDVIAGVDGSIAATRNSRLSVEHVEGGLGLYDITGELASLIKGNNQPFIWTIQYETLSDYHVEKIRSLIVDGYFVNLVILVPATVKMEDVELRCGSLFDLMQSTDRLAVFATFVLSGN